LLAGIAVTARLAFPRLIEAVVKARSPEVFSLTIILVAMGTAYVSGKAGLSMALGAFLAGVIISETHYSHHVTAQIMPLRDAFSSLFFVSIGMLVEPARWLADPVGVFGGTAGVIALKAATAALVALLFGLGGRSATAAGLSLAQIGEFSFILAQVGQSAGVLSEGTYQSFVSISVLSMAVTPLLVWLGRRAAGRGSALERMGRRVRQALRGESEGEHEEALTDHVILVGYGVNGRNVARALDTLGVSYVVLELNPGTARELRDSGVPVIYGDACQEALLTQAGIGTARAMVVSIADVVAARCISAVARTANLSLHVIVRTRFVAEVDRLYAQGASVVVPEEFETSLQLVALIMEAYGAAHGAIERERDLIRAENYGLLTQAAPGPATPLAGLLRAAELHQVSLPEGGSGVGKTLRDLDLRARTGALVVAIIRRGELIPNPEPSLPLESGDVLVLYGDDNATGAEERVLKGE